MSRSRSFYEQVEEFERKLICEALDETRGNQVQAAKKLGLPPTTLSSQIRRLGIVTEIYKPLGRFYREWKLAQADVADRRDGSSN